MTKSSKTRIIFPTIILCVSFVLVKISLAAPSVSGVSGTIFNGGSITISGSGFGTKASSSPYRWDNFSSGTIGQLVTGWSGGAGADIATYANAPAGRADTRAALLQFRPLTYNISLSANDPNGYPVLYIDYWYYLDKLGGDSRNFKPWRLYGGNPQDSLQMNPTMYCSIDGSHFVTYDQYGNTSNAWAGEQQTNRVWKHEQSIIRQGDPGVANGVVYRYVNSVPDVMFTNTGLLRVQSGVWNQIRIGHYWATDPVGNCASNPGADMYISDLYIDRTWSRVEIGNASTYASSTLREIQIPTAWNSNDQSITVTVNQGAFNASGNGYLYVVDSTGAVNANGYPITFGSGSVLDTTPPSAPTGLTVN